MITFFIPKGGWGGAQVVTYCMLRCVMEGPDAPNVHLVCLSSGRLVERAAELGVSCTVIERPNAGLWRGLRQFFGVTRALFFGRRRGRLCFASNYSLLLIPLARMIGRDVVFVNHGRPYHSRWVVQQMAFVAMALCELLCPRYVVVSPELGLIRRGKLLPNFLPLPLLPTTEVPFPATARSRVGRGVRILVIAEFAPNKNFDYALRCLRYAKQRGLDVECVVLGATNGLAPDSERAFVTAGFGFVGAVDDVRPYFEAVDCVVSFSANESFGLGILLALRCGVPVVATPTMGARYIARFSKGLTIFSSPKEFVDILLSVCFHTRRARVRHDGMLQRIWLGRARCLLCL
jgi:glycosyltransferase involved in cell wall biosynthesis